MIKQKDVWIEVLNTIEEVLNTIEVLDTVEIRSKAGVDSDL